jgi:transcription initiation factor TFIID subunit TAF12
MNALNLAIYDENNKDSIKGLDAGYHIGAAYFAKLKDLNYKYDDLWKLCLKPLLKEYVRGNRDPRGDLEKLEKAYNEALKGKSTPNAPKEDHPSETTQS